MTAPTVMLALALFVVLLLWVIALFKLGRRHRWALVPWMPGVALFALITVQLLLPVFFLLHPFFKGSDDPDSGFVGMAIGFYLMFAIPISVISIAFLIVFLIRFPLGVSWNLKGALAGALPTSFIVLGWFFTTHRYAGVEVLDAQGAPAKGMNVTFQVKSPFDFVSTVGIRQTDSNGVAHIYVPSLLPASGDWSASTTTADGTICSVNLSSNVNPQFPGHPEYRQINWSWRNASWGDWFSCSVSTYLPPGGVEDVALHLRNDDDMVEPWVMNMARQDIALVGTRQRAQNWVTVSSIENLEVLPDMLAIIRNGQISEPEKIILLDEAGGILNSWGNAAFDGLNKRGNERSKGLFSAYLKWAQKNAKSKDPETIQLDLRQQVEGDAAQLVDLSEPYWISKSFPGVGRIGKLATPYLPKILSSMAPLKENDPNLYRYFSFFQDLSGLKGDGSLEVDDIRPYFDNPNRVIAVCALLSVKWKIPRDELLARIQALSRPGNNSRVQWELGNLSNGGVKK